MKTNHVVAALQRLELTKMLSKFYKAVLVDRCRTIDENSDTTGANKVTESESVLSWLRYCDISGFLYWTHRTFMMLSLGAIWNFGKGTGLY
jgi:hypothetical protein